MSNNAIQSIEKTAAITNIQGVEAIAHAALSGDALLARSLTQDLLRSKPKWADIACPAVTDAPTLALAAALLELFAARQAEQAPEWTRIVGALPEPVYLLTAARTMKRLRELCSQQSPEPLRRRNLFAPPNYLEMV